MTRDTLIWWTAMCAVAALNVAAWTFSAAALRRPAPPSQREIWDFRRLQLLLSAGYVFGCAYRSALPVFDIPRLCLVDSWLSSVVVGRSVATVAELCFAAQWALLLHRASRDAGHRVGMRIARAVVPLIVVAETFSWVSVLTTANLGHVLEESIWGCSALLVVLAAAGLWPRCPRALRPALLLLGVAGLGYAAYMFSVDVPMYWARWLADQSQGRRYLGLEQGLLDAAGRWTVSYRWADWKSEVTWMSMYFSVAVWLSIGLVHAPVAARRLVRGAGKSLMFEPATLASRP